MNRTTKQAGVRLLLLLFMMTGLASQLHLSQSRNDQASVIIAIISMVAMALTASILIQWKEYAKGEFLTLQPAVQILSLVLVIFHLMLAPFTINMLWEVEKGVIASAILIEYVAWILLILDVIIDIYVFYNKQN